MYLYVCLYTFSLSEGVSFAVIRRVLIRVLFVVLVLSCWKTHNLLDFSVLFLKLFSLSFEFLTHRKERRIFVSLSSDVTVSLISSLSCVSFEGRVYVLLKRFRSARIVVCSLFFLSGFSVV